MKCISLGMEIISYNWWGKVFKESFTSSKAIEKIKDFRTEKR